MLSIHYPHAEPVLTDDDYDLIVIQNPRHARMCGFGERDRRPINPPPIVKIVSKRDVNTLVVNPELASNFIVHVSLWSEDGSSECSVIMNSPKFTRVLLGSLVASPERVHDENGKPGLFVCFPDLSVRTEGVYVLKFGLMRMDGKLSSKEGGRILTTTNSEAFLVYPAKKFPGMGESTALSKHFRRQGMNIPIRNSARGRKAENDTGEPGSSKSSKPVCNYDDSDDDAETKALNDALQNDFSGLTGNELLNIEENMNVENNEDPGGGIDGEEKKDRKEEMDNGNYKDWGEHSGPPG